MNSDKYPFENMAEAARSSGRKIAVIGGGTGLSTLLLGLKEYTENITAIVTVTDDGGGSGRLRKEFGVLPPGDIRNCLLALADTGSTMKQVLSYRFSEGSLDGQSFGNLFLLALNNIYGSFEKAVLRMHEILAVTGRVLPVTVEDVDLLATFEDGTEIVGETCITRAKKENGLLISDIRLSREAEALPEVIEAIGEADVLVLGPGSLYTSIIPNLLVNGVAEAVRKSAALKIFVMNIMTQEGETEGFTAGRHLDEMLRILGSGGLDVCLYNTAAVKQSLIRRYAGENAGQVFFDPDIHEINGVKLIGRDVLARGGDVARHDPLMLAYCIMDIANSLRPRQDELRKYDEYLLENR